MTPLYGVDLSNYQAGINMAGVAREGFTFAICKITQGSAYRSPAWPAQRDEGRRAGLVVAGYHYVDQTDPGQQALNCRNHIGDPNIAVALDLEKGGGDVGNYRRVLDAFRRAGLRVVLSYIPRWYWTEVGSPNLADLPPLWSSRYPSTDSGYASTLYQAVESAGGNLSKYWQGYGGNTVKILQFASTAQVQGRGVDANAFYGTPVELAALIGPASSTPPPPPPPPAPPAPEDTMPTAREVADAILDTPIPRLGAGMTGTTTLRSEVAMAGTTAEELRALRAAVGRLEARAPVAGEPVELEASPWRAELAELLESCAAAVRANEG